MARAHIAFGSYRTHQQASRESGVSTLDQSITPHTHSLVPCLAILTFHATWPACQLVMPFIPPVSNSHLQLEISVAAGWNARECTLGYAALITYHLSAWLIVHWVSFQLQAALSGWQWLVRDRRCNLMSAGVIFHDSTRDVRVTMRPPSHST